MSSVLARRYLESELMNATSLTLEEISLLIKHRRFPPAICHPDFGPSWNAIKIDAWAWGLRNSYKLAERVEIVLGYRRDDWAKSKSDDGLYSIFNSTFCKISNSLE